MDRKRLERVRDLFEQARELSRADREGWLAAECGADSELLREVESLLAEYDLDESLLEPGRTTDDLRRWVDATLGAASDGGAPPFEVPGYRIVRQLGEGAQGAVYEAEQDRPRRTVALKVLRPHLADSGLRGRFEREADTLARLTHPGIAVVHDSGVAETHFGPLPYFAMELVQGVPLTTFVERANLDREGRIQLFASICDAIAHAHEHGIVHRDLKPSNILVDADGRARVLDFGIARVLDSDVEAATLETRTGQVLGTLAYMSPEQASGQPGEVDQRADVFALGVLLFELLTGQLPRDLAGRPLPEQLRLLAEGETSLLGSLDRSLRGDLETIAAKAMAMEKRRRYAHAGLLAQDLRRYLRSEPITARPATTWYFVGRFVRRNRALSAALGFAVLALIVGAVTSFVLYLDARRGRDEILRLGGLKVHDDLVARASELWPPYPDKIEALESWLVEARELAAELPEYRAQLERVEARALPYTEEARARNREGHPLYEKLVAKDTRARAYFERRDAEIAAAGGEGYAMPSVEEGIARLREIVEERRTWDFAEESDGWQHSTLRELIRKLEAFEVELLSDGVSSAHGWSVPRRLEFARHMEEEFDPGGRYAEIWDRTLPDINDAYPGLDLEVQMGLVPISPDPHSGLWEFGHLITGDVPERRPDGTLDLREASGVVLVLIPYSSFWMGAQKDDPEAPAYDPSAHTMEGPVREVELSDHFLSKYEMTQGQWKRVTGTNPSLSGPDGDWAGGWLHPQAPASYLHPVESVSHDDCTTWLPRIDLSLPSEAQWEHGCRGGTDTRFWSGDTVRSLQDAANINDSHASRNSAPGTAYEAEINDGATNHWPVGTSLPNPFGLHDVHGNVSEWVLDVYGDVYYRWAARLDPVALGFEGSSRSIRGSSFSSMGADSRAGGRQWQLPGFIDHSLGVRPARGVDPGHAH